MALSKRIEVWELDKLLETVNKKTRKRYKNAMGSWVYEPISASKLYKDLYDGLTTISQQFKVEYMGRVRKMDIDELLNGMKYIGTIDIDNEPLTIGDGELHPITFEHTFKQGIPDRENKRKYNCACGQPHLRYLSVFFLPTPHKTKKYQFWIIGSTCVKKLIVMPNISYGLRLKLVEIYNKMIREEYTNCKKCGEPNNHKSTKEESMKGRRKDFCKKCNSELSKKHTRYNNLIKSKKQMDIMEASMVKEEIDDFENIV